MRIIGPRRTSSGMGRASGPGLMGAIETAKKDFRMMFWNLRIRVNYYYRPNGFFESCKREKAFA